MNIDDELERVALQNMGSTKRSATDTNRLAHLNFEKVEEGRTRFSEILGKKLEKLDVEFETLEKYDFASRENQAATCASVTFPVDAPITPATAEAFYRTLSSVLIEAGALAREANMFADATKDAYEELMSEWSLLSSQDVQWRMEAEVSDLSASLKEICNRAKRHAKFCESCFAQVTSTKFLIDALMNTWEKANSNSSFRAQ